MCQAYLDPPKHCTCKSCNAVVYWMQNENLMAVRTEIITSTGSVTFWALHASLLCFCFLCFFNKLALIHVWGFWNSSSALKLLLALYIEVCLQAVLASFFFQPWAVLFQLPWLNLLSARLPKFPWVWNINCWAAHLMFYTLLLVKSQHFHAIGLSTLCVVLKSLLKCVLFLFTRLQTHRVQNLCFAFFVAYGAFFGLGANNCDVFWFCRVKITLRLQKKTLQSSYFWPGHHFVAIELELETDFHFWILKSKALQECSIALSLLFICCDFYWFEVQTNSCKEELLIRETVKADPSICLAQAPCMTHIVRSPEFDA